MKLDTRFTGDDLRKIDPKFQSPRYERYLKAVELLDNFASKNYGKRVIHLAVRCILDQPGASIALWGARRPEQVEAVEGIIGWSLDKEALEAIDKIIKETIKDPVGPEFMAPPARIKD
jgi:aryl-alcohol dehydrogenase-like predicted oxidoreductase